MQDLALILMPYVQIQIQITNLSSMCASASNIYLIEVFTNQGPGLWFPFPRYSRARAKKITSRGICAVFWRYFRGFFLFRVLCRSHKGTAKSPSRKSRLIGKCFPFRGKSAEFRAGILAQLKPQATLFRISVSAPIHYSALSSQRGCVSRSRVIHARGL